jgi:uncharacterized membrane protein (UPF0136 family)
MNDYAILWTYIVLLVAGGVMGFVKGKSKVSLITSVASALLLTLCALNTISFGYSIWILGALLIVFAMRLMKTKKLMPAGLLTILTILAIALISAL